MPDASLLGLRSRLIRRHSHPELRLLSSQESAALEEEKAEIQDALLSLDEAQKILGEALAIFREADELLRKEEEGREELKRIFRISSVIRHGTLEEQAHCLDQLQGYLKVEQPAQPGIVPQAGAGPHESAATKQAELMEGTRKGVATCLQEEREEEEEWRRLVKGVEEGTPEESARCLKLLKKWMEEQEATLDELVRQDALATPLEHEAPGRLGDGLLPELDSLGEHVVELRRRRDEVDQLLQNSAEAEEAVLCRMTGMGLWQDAWRREQREEALEEAQPRVPRPASSHAQTGRCGTKRNKATRRKMASHEVMMTKLAVHKLADHRLGRQKSEAQEPGRQEEEKRETDARISRGHEVDHQDRTAQPVKNCFTNPFPTDRKHMQLTAEEVAFAPHMERILQLLEDE